MISLPSIQTPPDAPAWARSMAALLTRSFGIIADAFRSRPASCYVEVTANTTANAPFVVRHTLGAVPRFASAMSASNGYIYATADDKAEWTREQIKIRHNVAGDRIVVKVEV